MLNRIIEIQQNENGIVTFKITSPPWALKDDYTLIEVGDDEFPNQYNPNWSNLWSEYTSNSSSILNFNIRLNISGTMTIVSTGEIVDGVGGQNYTFGFDLSNFSIGASSYPIGDLDFDGSVGYIDSVILQSIIEGSELNAIQYQFADIDGNGIVNEDDMVLFQEILLNGVQGYQDVNPFFNDSIIYWYNTSGEGTHAHNVESYQFAVNNLYESNIFTLSVPEGSSLGRMALYDNYMFSAYKNYPGYGGLSDNINEWPDEHKVLFINSCWLGKIPDSFQLLIVSAILLFHSL